MNELEVWEGSSFFLEEDRLDFRMLGLECLVPRILTHGYPPDQVQKHDKFMPVISAVQGLD